MNGSKKNIITQLTIALSVFCYIILFLSVLPSQAQDYNNPCFYCHMNVLVETKKKAPAHWDNGVDCEVCHGPSGEHVDVEDNTIKPDSIWTDSDVHKLCDNCHDDIFAEYASSAHAKLTIAENPAEDKKGPSCMTCHGAHGLISNNDMKDRCLGCHTQFLEKYKDTPADEESSDTLICSNCHTSHSLTKKPAPPNNNEEKK